MAVSTIQMIGNRPKAAPSLAASSACPAGMPNAKMATAEGDDQRGEARLPGLPAQCAEQNEQGQQRQRRDERGEGE